jgi:hypothetical protein
MGRCAASPEIAKVLIDHGWPSSMDEQRWVNCWHARSFSPTPAAIIAAQLSQSFGDIRQRARIRGRMAF